MKKNEIYKECTKGDTEMKNVFVNAALFKIS